MFSNDIISVSLAAFKPTLNYHFNNLVFHFYTYHEKVCRQWVTSLSFHFLSVCRPYYALRRRKFGIISDTMFSIITIDTVIIFRTWDCVHAQKIKAPMTLLKILLRSNCEIQTERFLNIDHQYHNSIVLYPIILRFTHKKSPCKICSKYPTNQ